jgi:hypothetical protein
MQVAFNKIQRWHRTSTEGSLVQWGADCLLSTLSLRYEGILDRDQAITFLIQMLQFMVLTHCLAVTQHRLSLMSHKKHVLWRCQRSTMRLDDLIALGEM